MAIESFRVRLSPAELADFNRRFPLSQGSNQIGKRAIEIVKVHFLRRHPGCSFVSPVRGADLAVVVDAAEPRQYEVKGTADLGFAWQQLKVSSKASHDLLASNGVSVLRVTNVNGEEPVVFELRHERDFLLEPEARWSFKPVRGA